ncbi:MAG: FMN-binding protein [Ruminococcaceae bacterium]|nr:FMN-binding protein [Oscillospiraceae bacterium]
MENKSYIKNMAVVALKLLLICSVIAGVVSFVYTVTLGAYQANLDREIRQSMATVFEIGEGEKLELTVYDGALGDDIKDIYTVSVNGETVGYCVNVVGKGFGGNMDIMVGYHPDKTIRGVSIVSHAETPGVGSKVSNADHLSQYNGHSDGLTISKRPGADITAISGATISSNAVHAAIERASEALYALPAA